MSVDGCDHCFIPWKHHGYRCFEDMRLFNPRKVRPPLDLPLNQLIERREDMSPRGYLRLILQEDGDVVITVVSDPDEGFSGSVEFCMPFTGGGRSPHTIKALRELAAAIIRDNAETLIGMPGE